MNPLYGMYLAGIPNIAPNALDYSPGGQLDRLLRLLKSVGHQWIRAGVVPYNYSQLAATKTYAAFVKSYGFKVVWGITCSNFVTGQSTSTDWTNFKAAIASNAAWAQANGIDIFCIGNEEDQHLDNTTLTPAMVQADFVGSIISDAKANFTGPCIVSVSAGNMDNYWRPGGTATLTGSGGTIDYIGLNQYDSLSHFIDKVTLAKQTFGSRVMVTEWNVQSGYASTGIGGGFNDELTYARENGERLRLMLSLGIQNFFFNAMDNTLSSGDSYALILPNGNRRLAWDRLIQVAGGSSVNGRTI